MRPIPSCWWANTHQFAPSIFLLFALFLHFPTSQSALILPVNSVLELNQEIGFALPDSIRRELDQIERSKLPAQKRSPHSIPISSEDNNDDQSSEEGSNGGIPILSILGKLGQIQQNQCFCCKAFVCRRQTCPCSKFYL